jgi:hypothetical protein
MTFLMKLAALVIGAAVLASSSAAAPSAGMSPRGTAAYGATLEAEAAQYVRGETGMTPAGLRAYGKTLQAEAQSYTAARPAAAPRGFAWGDAGIGAAGALTAVLVAALLVRPRRGPFAPAAD